jgi:GTP-binding protein
MHGDASSPESVCETYSAWISPQMIDLRNIDLAKVARSPRDFPRDGRPQVCFAGRSNVGKSSLINALVGRSKLARTSKTPGRTREIHFFLLADRAYLVDLPGYGYARVSQATRKQWARLIDAYLTDNERLRLLVAILDIRRDPNEDDFDLLAWLEHHGIPYLVVLTKCDKVSKSEFGRQRRTIVDALERRCGPRIEDGPCQGVVAFSAKTGEGRRELTRSVLAAVDVRRKTSVPSEGETPS